MKKIVNTYVDGKIVKTEEIETPDDMPIEAQIAAAKTVDELRAVLLKVVGE